QGRSPPRGQRLLQQAKGAPVVAVPGRLPGGRHQRGHRSGVDCVRSGLQKVPGGYGHDGEPRLSGVAVERLPEPQDVVLQRLGRRPRRVVTPQDVDQPRLGDDLGGMEGERGEETSLLGAADRYWPVTVDDLERTEDAHLHWPGSYARCAYSCDLFVPCPINTVPDSPPPGRGEPPEGGEAGNEGVRASLGGDEPRQAG